MPSQRRKLILKGTTPLLMHNGQLVDPLNPVNQEMRQITNKKSKDRTLEDIEELARLEWLGSLYTDAQSQVCLPGRNLAACIRDGAKRERFGATVQRALLVEDLDTPLVYDGPADIDELYRDGRFRDRRNAGVGRNSVMRTRPIFHDWGATFHVQFDDEQLDENVLARALEYAGAFIGIGDGTKIGFGRFEMDLRKA